ncbi:MAG: HNH endonuclease [Lachnospiraceae bacterium]|nr:HNH endonuclease [Lachnospiraceae bacterium]
MDLVGEDKEAITIIRVNQGEFRDRLLNRYDKCCLCGVSSPLLLTASHIKPWAASEPSEKLDVNNGLLMCPNHDKLFDKGFISFDDLGNIMISSKLVSNDQIFMNVNGKMHISVIEENKKYLDYHRTNVFQG